MWPDESQHNNETHTHRVKCTPVEVHLLSPHLSAVCLPPPPHTYTQKPICTIAGQTLKSMLQPQVSLLLLVERRASPAGPAGSRRTTQAILVCL